MADDNIFQQYLRAPKSVMDYTAEYDAADARKQTLRQNALELAAGQQKYDDGVQSRTRADQLRQALLGLPQGATDDQRIQAMRGTASPEGYAAADALDKSLIERRKGTAAADKDAADTADKEYKLKIAKHDQALRDMSSFQSPQEAMQSLQQHVTSGELPPEQAQMFAAQLQTMNPKDFPAWQLGMVRRLMSASDEMKYRAPDANNIATNARAAAEGAANRAVTIAGQNKVDARAREAASQGRIPTGYRANPDGSLAPIPGGPADPKIVKGKPTEFEGKSAIFGARAEEADKILSQLKYSPAAVNIKRSMADTPLIGGMLGTIANNRLSDADQQAEQAQRDFINAVLRQESGATINPPEFDNADKQYFPQPGDSKAVIQQKANARKITIQGLKRNAGNSAFTAGSGAGAAKPSLNDIFK